MNSDDEVTSSEEDGNRQGLDTDQILEEVHSQEFYHTLANPEIKFVVGSQVNGKPYLLHNGTVHKGCYFHMTQAQQKKLRSLNLGPYYNKDVRFSEWVNKWKVLAVIPSLHIEELVEYLLDRQHPDHQ
uniref:Uncharacterized protein n=1 Tax=Ditylenchus dipsaci TaxID=166011 RepID=A0A915CWV3_9BILA